MKTYVYELIAGITSYNWPGDGHMMEAETLYGRYLSYMHDHRTAAEPISLAQFLFAKIEPTGFDSFVWPKDTLVKIKSNGMLGMVTDWRDVGCSSSHVEVEVKHARGTGCFRPDQIEKAEVPPEVLEYVASTLKGKVHGKVDEAFDGGGDGQ